jgi:hypothetical protein
MGDVKMSNNQEDNPILHLVIKIAEDGPLKNKPLHISGLSNINPFHEALVALFRKNLTDPQIVEAYAKDEESLRKLLVIDAFFDNLPPQKKQNLGGLLTTGKSLSEIIDRAALEVNEGKRAKDGKMLVSVATDYDHLKHALRHAPASSVYIEHSEYGNIQKKAGKIRKRKIIFYTALAGLAAFIGAGCFILKNTVNYSFSIEDKTSGKEIYSFSNKESQNKPEAKAQPGQNN